MFLIHVANNNNNNNKYYACQKESHVYENHFSIHYRSVVKYVSDVCLYYEMVVLYCWVLYFFLTIERNND